MSNRQIGGSEMSCKGFTTGVITGAVIGAAFGMLVDPINDRNHRKMSRTKENMFKALGGMLDDLLDK